MKNLLEYHNIPYESEKEIEICIRNKVIGVHRLDLVVFNEVVVELKAVVTISKAHIAQIKSYLIASRFKVGLILNFADAKLGVRRFDLEDILKKRYR